MRIFVKCLECGHVIYTERREVFTLLGGDFTCAQCEKHLDYVDVTLCSKFFGDWCNNCQYRFQCFALDPVGGLTNKNNVL